MKKDFQIFMRECLWPRSFFSKLSVLLGGLSLMGLLIYSINFGISNAISKVLAWYNKFLDITLGWLTYPINMMFDFLNRILNISISLEDHWKHIFVILNIYFIRNAFSYARGDKNLHPKRSASIFLVGLGVVMSFLISASTGVISGSSNSSIFLVVFIPLLGIFFYDLIERAWYVISYTESEAYEKFGIDKKQALRFYISRAVERFFLCLMFGCLVAFIAVLYLKNIVDHAGIIGFLSSVLFLSLYWITGRASLNFHYLNDLDNDLPILHRLVAHSGTTYLGQMMLGTFFYLLVFVLLNSGLSLIGL